MATWTDPIPEDQKCPMCNGKGIRASGRTCILCGGTGRKNA